MKVRSSHWLLARRSCEVTLVNMKSCGAQLCICKDLTAWLNSRNSQFHVVVYSSRGWQNVEKRWTFFSESCLTPLPPPTFLIEYVFPMLMFSEIFFYINNLLLSTALCGIRFTTTACPVTRHELIVHASGNNNTLAIGYRHYASWVANGFRKDGSGVYWWRWGDSRGVLLYRFLSVLAVSFSLQVFESRCAFRLLIPPVPTCTSALHSSQRSLLSAVNWFLFLQPRLAMVWSVFL